jgi:protein-L-isoaspartate(D-aspartate) O-methyltransferase
VARLKRRATVCTVDQEGTLTMAVGPDAGSTGELREQMVLGLQKRGMAASPPVLAAFRAVPRHLFIPEADPEDVYAASEAVITKRDAAGRPVSSVSAAWLQATMLETARIRPGMHVLEIGSGGCNAALLAELVGPTGSVTTADIDPEIAARARRLLDAAGYPQVRVLHADGAEPAPDAPAGGFDVVMVTVGAADLAPAWLSQLAPTGRLLVPLRFRGLSRTVAFVREENHLRCDTLIVSGFVAMQGALAHTPRTVPLADPQTGLGVDEDQPADPDTLRAAFGTARQELWSGSPSANPTAPCPGWTSGWPEFWPPAADSAPARRKPPAA